MKFKALLILAFSIAANSFTTIPLQAQSMNSCGLSFSPAKLTLSALLNKTDVQLTTVTNKTLRDGIIISTVLTAEPFSALNELPVMEQGLKPPVICKRGQKLAPSQSCILPVSFTPSKDSIFNSLVRIVYYNQNKISSYCTMPVTGIVTGSIDGSFANGRVLSDKLLVDSSPSITIDSSNRVLAAVTYYTNPKLKGMSPSLPAVVRFLPNGKIDTTFGESGYAVLPDDGLKQSASFNTTAVVRSNYGELVLAAGSYYSKSDYQYKTVVARFLPNGKLDPAFGNGKGYVISKLLVLVWNTPLKLIVQKNGSFAVVLMGAFSTASAAIAGFDVSGNVLPSFGEKGYAEIVPPGYARWDQGGSIGFGESRVLIWGSAATSDYSQSGQFAGSYDITTAKFDPKFGQNGFIKSNGINNFIYLRENRLLGVQSAYSYGPDMSNIQLLKLLPNGYPDKTFGVNGIVSSLIGNGGFASYYAKLLHVDIAGRVYAIAPSSGYNIGSQPVRSVFRFNSNGKHDKTYGKDGLVNLPAIEGYTEEYNTNYSYHITSDMKLLEHIAVAKYPSPPYTDPIHSIKYLFKYLL